MLALVMNRTTGSLIESGVNPSVGLQMICIILLIASSVGFIGIIFSGVNVAVKYSVALTMATLFAGSIFGLINEKADAAEAVEKTNSNISEVVSDKYGVTLHEGVLEKNANASYSEFNRGAISASNSEGQRIQVTLELTEDDTDILAFFSGAEMPKVAAK